jgi:hypothetical protein
MGRHLRRILLIAQLTVLPFFNVIIAADPPGPPPPRGNPADKGGYHVGDKPAKAPIKNGISILLSLGMAYGSFKIYENWKKVN